MTPRAARLAVLAAPVAALALVAGPAAAAPTATATLVCEDGVYTVSGFGRGQTLHVVGSTQRYVVTSARLEDGTQVFDAPGQADRGDVVACSATSPSPAPRSGSRASSRRAPDDHPEPAALTPRRM
jgi:hypothetical protein